MLGEELPDDPCASVTCGEFGACIGLNGQAACVCDEGYGATEADDGSLGCESLDDGTVVNGPVDPDVTPDTSTPEGTDPTQTTDVPDSSVVATDSSDPESDSACSVSAGDAGSTSQWLLLGAVLGLVAIRRRRV